MVIQEAIELFRKHQKGTVKKSRTCAKACDDATTIMCSRLLEKDPYGH
jgi:hypothetical protein